MSRRAETFQTQHIVGRHAALSATLRWIAAIPITSSVLLFAGFILWGYFVLLIISIASLSLGLLVWRYIDGIWVWQRSDNGFFSIRTVFFRIAILVLPLLLVTGLAAIHLARTPVVSDDSEVEFAVKIMAKRAVGEVSAFLHSVTDRSFQKGTNSQPIRSPGHLTLDVLPLLDEFSKSNPGSGLELARNLSDVLRKMTVFGSSSLNLAAMSTSDTLQQAAEGHPFLCGDIARLYGMVAPAFGLDVRVVYLWSSLGDANHVVTEIWDQERNKWVVIDVQENLILTTNGGTEPLSAVEINDMVRADQKFAITPDPNGEDSFYSGYELDEYLEKYRTIAVLMRSDIELMSFLPSYHPANIESQSVSLYEESENWLARLYYEQKATATELARPPLIE